MKTLDDCIQALRIKSGKTSKYSPLKRKMEDRFVVKVTVQIDKIGDFKIGFDNHKNHNRPHIHTEYKKQRNSFAIDNGQLLHGASMPVKEQAIIKEWISDRRECLDLIYSNIENCKSKADFDPIINAMKKFI